MRQPHFGRCAFVYRQGFVCFLLAGVCLSAGVAFHFTPAYYPTSLRDSVLANLQFASGEEGIFNSHIIVEAPRCGVSAFFVLGCAAAMVLRQGLHYISPLPNIRRHSVTWAGVRRNPGGVAAM